MVSVGLEHRACYYTDTLGRRVQIKTESEVDGEKYWTVSGALARDNFGRVIEQGIVTKTDYTDDSLIDNSDASLEYSTSFEYDDFGRFCKAVSANEYEVYKSYDKRVEDGIIIFVETLTDIEERESRIYRDVLGREIKTQVKREDESFACTCFYYDLHGYGRVTEPTGGVGEKQTDSLGRIQWIKTPDAGRKEYFYNDKGLISSIIKYGKEEAGSRQIDIIYDILSRISQINYPGTDNDISYTYYGTGEEIDKYAKSNIKTITKGDYYEVQYNFDQFWIQEVKTIEGSTYSTKYEYDVQGRINELSYPDGEVVKYNYNEGGFLKSIIGNDTYIHEIIYDEFGQRKLVKYGNSTEVSYTYTPETRLLDMMTTKDKHGNTVLNYNYDFDITGNLEELTNTVDGITKSVQEYSYDKLGRIKSAAGNYMDGFSTYERSYKFDDDNRMMYKNFKDGKRYDFSYLADTHAISHINVTGDPGITDIDFEYDDFGNMINKQVFKDAALLEETEFTYDENDRMSGFDDGVISLSFKYDNRGQRIVKDCLDEVGVLKENRYVNGFYTISDGTPTKHISDGAYVFATLIQNNPDNIVFYSSNNIGSTVLLTNKEGSVVQEYLYTPYGEMWVEETPEAYKEITRLFSGHEFDSETGLYYMNARYYDPHIGVFMRPDPAMDGLNHYAYCTCNPIRYTDPTGLGPEDSSTEKKEEGKDENKSTGNKGGSGDTETKTKEAEICEKDVNDISAQDFIDKLNELGDGYYVLSTPVIAGQVHTIILLVFSDDANDEGDDDSDSPVDKDNKKFHALELRGDDDIGTKLKAIGPGLESDEYETPEYEGKLKEGDPEFDRFFRRIQEDKATLYKPIATDKDFNLKKVKANLKIWVDAWNQVGPRYHAYWAPRGFNSNFFTSVGTFVALGSGWWQSVPGAGMQVNW